MTGERPQQRTHAANRGRSIWLRCAALLGACALAACGGSLLQTERPAAEIYVLAPAENALEDAKSLAVDISVARPAVAPGLDSDRIAVLTGRRLDYYQAARWGGVLAEVVQDFVVSSLENQGQFRSVTAEQARIADDYLIDLDVRDFQAEYSDGAAPTIRVKLVGRIIRVTDRQLLATIGGVAQQPAQQNRMSAVAAAFEAAAQRAAADIGRAAAAAIAADRGG